MIYQAIAVKRAKEKITEIIVDVQTVIGESKEDATREFVLKNSDILKKNIGTKVIVVPFVE